MEIKSSELRIGSILEEKYSGDKLVVSELTRDRITFGYQTQDKWQAVPIGLSDEIMLKCGFEGNNETIFTKEDISSIYFSKPYLEAKHYLVKAISGDKITSVFFLHQLQNIHFALTGKELTINL